MPSQPGSGWYVHLQGEALGPFATEKLVQMLSQNRVGFADFAWTEGYTKWIRISEIDEFAAHLPEYPKIGIPKASASAKSTMDLPTPATKEEPSKPAPQKSKPKKLDSRFLRVPFDGKLVTTAHGTYDIINIAERGVFVAASAMLKVGTELQFSLEGRALGNPLQMRGVVIRQGQDGEMGFAVEFTRLNPIHKNLIEQYVRKKAESEE